MPHNAPIWAYQTLGVTPRDDLKSVRDAWRALARAFHPDVVGGCPDEASKTFSRINQAYDVLRAHLLRHPVEISDEREHAYAEHRKMMFDRAKADLVRERARQMQARRADAKLQAEAKAHDRINTASQSAPGTSRTDTPSTSGGQSKSATQSSTWGSMRRALEGYGLSRRVSQSADASTRLVG